MELTLDQALQKGIEAHKAGRAQEADRYYTAIIKANPKHPDANHNMGILTVGFGKVETALPFFKTALEANPNIAQFWLSYIDALIKLERIAEAKAVFDQAKSAGAKGDKFDKLKEQLRMSGSKNYKNLGTQDPSVEQLKLLISLYKQAKYAEALNDASQLLLEFPYSIDLWNILGAAYQSSGKIDEAIEAFKKALTIKPDCAEAYNNMGNAFKEIGELDEAIKAYTHAFSIKLDYAEAYYNMGNALQAHGKLDRAIEAFKNAFSIKSDYVEAYNNMGIALQGQGKLKEAEKAFKKAISIKPDYAEASNNMGNVLKDQGKLIEAIEAYNKALAINSDNAETHYNMGNTRKEQGKLSEAVEAFKKALSIKPNYAVAYYNMGNTLKEQGNLKETVEAFKKALSIKPDYGEAYNNMGVTLHDQGKLDAAIETFNKVLSIKPDYAEAYYNMGNALQDQGKLIEAIEAYNKALSIKPDYAEAYNNLGNTLKDQGKLNEALEAYNKALSIKPDYAEAYNNLGIVFQDQKKQDNAIEAFKKALSIKPDYAEAYNNVGIVLKELDRLDEAIEAFKKALSTKPDYAEAYNNMGITLKGTILNKPNRDLQETIFSLLDKEKYVRPNDIAKAIISLLKLEPTLQKHLQLVDFGIIENLTDVISDLSEFPLLQKLMSICPIPDLELEKLFRKLRWSILSNVLFSKEVSPKLIGFQSALALQCFTNEYIYNNTAEEDKALQALESKVKNAFTNKEQPTTGAVLALASYKALTKYSWCNLLVVTDDIQEVFARQVEEPNKEEKLKQYLPLHEEITDTVSSEVRAQYEESPYPRWVNLGLPLKPMSITNVIDEIKLKLHDNKIIEVKEPKILIAGCGTGQHSIGTAARFKSSHVLAIDLSLSSLAYAKRKSEELGVKNIDYMQADILALGRLSEQFDIIESAGVLHHMDNPMAGWKVLTDCLKSGGLMNIGLYSELARQHIVKIRREISKAGISSSDAEMKSFRETLIKSEKTHHIRISNSLDFYSTSTLKDLLFHVQEHRFTIPQIQECLSKLGLKFCGFSASEKVSHFKQTNNNKDDLYDLDKWLVYEKANPRAFAGMYQFWCQKVE